MSLTRAYSIVTITKAIDNDGERVLAGTATTPAVDRVGDIVEPLGVHAAPDIALLLHHDSRLVVGRARLSRPTATSVPFTATMPKIAEPGTLKTRVDEAWGMVTHGLIRGVSIGFRPVAGKVEPLSGGGLRFLEIEVVELSLVAVPANAEATIDQIKAIDRALRRTVATSARAAPSTAATAVEDLEHMANSKIPATLGVVAQMGAKILRALRDRDARVKEIAARISELQSRLDKQAQQQSAMEKRLAAFERKGNA